MNSEYNPAEIEKKYQNVWQEEKTFSADDNSSKESFYALEMFPYPSGKLHMGHVSNYTIVDAIARYAKLKGYDVLHPIGWDAFGLPAENAAIQNNIPPAKWTYENIEHMRIQLKNLGFSYDWDREVATCSPDYYKWGQWFIIQMYKKGLLYRKKAEVNWCEDCGTVLANEQVTQDGSCWRCDSEVEKKALEQWYIRVTDYAEELLSGHDEIRAGWPERVLKMQENWIGKSIGAELEFKLDDGKPFPIFTTRPDTAFGVSYMAIAWNHKDLFSIAADEKHDELKAFVEKAKNINQRENFEKEGVFTGRYVINPLTEEKSPLYAANFVLAEYGSGCIMAVPAHDQRDFEFAKKYGLEIKVVIQNEDSSLKAEEMEAAYTDDGTLVNSGKFDGMNNREAIEAITNHAQEQGFGTKKVQYKLKDWLISRQRYWGNPLPFIYCDLCGVVPVPEDDLPVKLPEDVNFEGVVGNPLASNDEFINVTCPVCGRPSKRETDTMDTFTCSSWYYARYTDAKNDSAPFDAGKAKLRLPVDQYVGGIEHACMHLLYARFWHKFMRDIGLTDTNEPFKRLLTQGMVVSESFYSAKLKKYYTKEEYDSGLPKEEDAGEIEVNVDKMSKSKRNGVDPQMYIDKYGADTVRVFVMFASPPEADVEWSDEGVRGAQRYLNRVWRLFGDYSDRVKALDDSKFDPSALKGAALKLYKLMHKTVKKATEDIGERYHFNTAIAAMMELMNEMNSFNTKDENELLAVKEILKNYALLLNPIAPHITEELWSAVGGSGMISESAQWPEFKEEYCKDDSFELVVQVNGKLRDKIEVDVNISKEAAEEKALSSAKVKEHIEGKNLVKVIYVPKKLINVVVK